MTCCDGGGGCNGAYCTTSTSRADLQQEHIAVNAEALLSDFVEWARDRCFENVDKALSVAARRAVDRKL